MGHWVVEYWVEIGLFLGPLLIFCHFKVPPIDEDSFK